MGLDMYLNAKRYVSRSLWDNANQTREENPKWTEIAEASGLAGYSGDDWTGIYVNATAIYWRKANAIHNWFVLNVQGGEDNCSPHWVALEQLVELRDLVRQVNADHSLAEDLLPPTEGFFFGTTELDEWYWNDMETTEKDLDRVIAMAEEDKMIEFEYQSSW